MTSVECLTTGRMVRVPRKVKKQASKQGLVITARVGKAWLTAMVMV